MGKSENPKLVIANFTKNSIFGTIVMARILQAYSQLMSHERKITCKHCRCQFAYTQADYHSADCNKMNEINCPCCNAEIKVESNKHW